MKRSLRIKKAGNDLVALLGGRSVHPVGVCVGGFYRAPDAAAAARAGPRAEGLPGRNVRATLFLAEHIEFPSLERDYEFVALCPEDEYPMNLGRIRSNKGLNVDQEEFGRAIEERQVAHSTALHAVVKDRGPYLVGPLARLNLNAEKLRPRAAELLPKVCKAVGKPLPWRNNYFSLLARGSGDRACAGAGGRLAGRLRPAGPRRGCRSFRGPASAATARKRPAASAGTSTAPTRDGTIASARIIPPTSQNYATIEADLRALAPQVAELSGRGGGLALRTPDPQLRSVHQLFGAFSPILAVLLNPGNTLAVCSVAWFGGDVRVG